MNSLEKYTAVLEEENRRLNRELLFIENTQTKDYERVQKELWQYQKALEKACDYLARTSTCEYNEHDLPMCKNCKRNKTLNGLCNESEQWKEWLLKDE